MGVKIGLEQKEKEKFYICVADSFGRMDSLFLDRKCTHLFNVTNREYYLNVSFFVYGKPVGFLDARITSDGQINLEHTQLLKIASDGYAIE
jgi:hypothetical protein